MLAQDFNTSAANDIEPVESFSEGDPRNEYEGYTLKETYVYNMIQVNGKKVIFVGVYNKDREVDRRILINGSAGETAL